MHRLLWATILLLSAGFTLICGAFSQSSECSLSKTNNSCNLTLDRRNLVTPPAIQMYSGQTVTVVVAHPYLFERYSLDLVTAQGTVSPDAVASLVGGLEGPLSGTNTSAHAQSCSTSVIQNVTDSTVPDKVTAAFRKCAAQLSSQAIPIYKALEVFTSPDSLPQGNPAPCDPCDLKARLKSIQGSIASYVKSEIAASAAINVYIGKWHNDLPTDMNAAKAAQELGFIQKGIDAIAADLLVFSQRISDVEATMNTAPVKINTRPDDASIYTGMTTRTVTYALNAYNLIANSQEAVTDPSKKTTIATIVIDYADRTTKRIGLPYTALRWEVSAGVFISSLSNQTFSVAPVYTGTAISNNTVAETPFHPTLVPFAAANYRLTNDLGWTQWKSDLYWTGAVGFNPNTKSVDYATGPSISYRAALFSLLLHFGHATRLTQGFYRNESLGPAFTGTLPTETYWTPGVAIGISVRVPSITGR